MTVLNPSNTFKPTAYVAANFYQLVGQRAKDFYIKNVQQFQEVEQVERLTLSEKRGHDVSFIEKVGYPVQALMVTSFNLATRYIHEIYFLKNEQGYQDCLDMLRANGGTNPIRFEKISKFAKTEKNADSTLYQWEDKIFGDSAYLSSHYLEAQRFSTAELNRRLHNSCVMIALTFNDALEMCKKVAKAYNLVNLSVEEIPFNGNTFGNCEYNVYFQTITVRFCKSPLYLHTVLHELAHAIDYKENGDSGHGESFRKVYETLLRDYHPGLSTIEIPSDKEK